MLLLGNTAGNRAMMSLPMQSAHFSLMWRLPSRCFLSQVCCLVLAVYPLSCPLKKFIAGCFYISVFLPHGWTATNEPTIYPIFHISKFFSFVHLHCVPAIMGSSARNKRRNPPATPRKLRNERLGPNDVQRKVKLVTEQKKMYVSTINPLW